MGDRLESAIGQGQRYESKDGLQNEAQRLEVRPLAWAMALTRGGFLDDLLRLSQTHPGLLWEEKIVEPAPEVSDFYVTTDRIEPIIVSVRDGLEDARVMVDDYVFESVPASELYDFLAAVLDGDWEVRPKKGFWKPSQMEARRGDRRWLS
ncbi:hypothetical protein [Kribbella solani]|uniref:Uncharacterized protein n=1 Tax=Kribbella solani TaxID=236067 RepID=A0A841DPN0_9ACTN|nr:hypothetical protein [Kribbella solani]MBB5979851.1 hypothetical protein [Kribbella solani]